MNIEEVWKDEPERLSFESNGFKCLIVRHSTMRHLCGFIGIPEGNIHYKADYYAIDSSLEQMIHKGITMSDFGTYDLKPDDIYYKDLYDEEGNNLWWIGFDCSRVDDLTPSDYYISKSLGLDPRGEYRDLKYVRSELVKLSYLL